MRKVDRPSSLIDGSTVYFSFNRCFFLALLKIMENAAIRDTGRSTEKALSGKSVGGLCLSGEDLCFAGNG